MGDTMKLHHDDRDNNTSEQGHQSYEALDSNIVDDDDGNNTLKQDHQSDGSLNGNDDDSDEEEEEDLEDSASSEIDESALVVESDKDGVERSAEELVAMEVAMKKTEQRAEIDGMATSMIYGLENQGRYIDAFTVRYSQYLETVKLMTARQCCDRLREMILSGNSYVVKMHQSDPKDHESLRLLEKIETILLTSTSKLTRKIFNDLLSVVYNNFSCIYKKRGKLHYALAFANRAVQAETKIKKRSIGTHLNICAILSEMRRHREAARHARIAVIAAKDACGRGQSSPTTFQQKNNVAKFRASTKKFQVAEACIIQIGSGTQPPLFLLTASLFSLGAQLEHMNNLAKACEVYEETRSLITELEDPPGIVPNLTEIEHALAEVRANLDIENEKPQREIGVLVRASTSKVDKQLAMIRAPTRPVTQRQPSRSSKQRSPKFKFASVYGF